MVKRKKKDLDCNRLWGNKQCDTCGMPVDTKKNRFNLLFCKLEIQYMNFPKKWKDKKERTLKPNNILI